MQKKIEVQLDATIDDDVDILDHYQDFKDQITTVCGATSVVARTVQYLDQPDETKIVSFITDVVVDRDYDFGEHFEAFRDAAAAGLAAQALAILCANESDLPD